MSSTGGRGEQEGGGQDDAGEKESGDHKGPSSFFDAKRESITLKEGGRGQQPAVRAWEETGPFPRYLWRFFEECPLREGSRHAVSRQKKGLGTSASSREGPMTSRGSQGGKGTPSKPSGR